MAEDLIEVRCPLTIEYEVKHTVVDGDGAVKKVGTGKIVSHVCDKLSIRVFPGSSGEAYCRFCRKHFDFEVDSQTTHIQKIEERIE